MMTTAVAGGAAGAGAEAFARDAIIAWFRGEFAAANAIIDELCGHLAQIEGGSEYEEVFAAIHRRRMNWIPVLHMQKYFSIADVAGALRRVVTRRQLATAAEEEAEIKKGREAEMEVAAMKEEKYSKDSPKEEEAEMVEERSIDGVVVVGTSVEEVEDGDSNGDSSDRKVLEEVDADGEVKRSFRSGCCSHSGWPWSNLVPASTKDGVPSPLGSAHRSPISPTIISVIAWEIGRMLLHL